MMQFICKFLYIRHMERLLPLKIVQRKIYSILVTFIFYFWFLGSTFLNVMKPVAQELFGKVLAKVSDVAYPRINYFLDCSSTNYCFWCLVLFASSLLCSKLFLSSCFGFCSWWPHSSFGCNSINRRDHLPSHEYSIFRFVVLF